MKWIPILLLLSMNAHALSDFDNIVLGNNAKVIFNSLEEVIVESNTSVNQYILESVRANTYPKRFLNDNRYAIDKGMVMRQLVTMRKKASRRFDCVLNKYLVFGEAGNLTKYRGRIVAGDTPVTNWTNIAKLVEEYVCIKTTSGLVGEEEIQGKDY